MSGNYRDYAGQPVPSGRSRPEHERIDDLTMNEDWAFAVAWDKIFPSDRFGRIPEEFDEPE